MKVHIVFQFKDIGGGGGNVFLKGLRNFLIREGVYTESVDAADILLVNSYQYLDEALAAKQRRPEALVVQRIDGPISLYNAQKDHRDALLYCFAGSFTDGIIFQSEWSRQFNRQAGLRDSGIPSRVILNGPDEKIFHRAEQPRIPDSRRLRLCASSWSPNWNKGFETYQWLDEHLDFSGCEFDFYGRSPVTFKNIRVHEPVASEQMGEILREHDFFIFASKVEACSNTLMEAASCLPVIAYDGSSNGEVLSGAGRLFREPAEIPAILADMEKNWSFYHDRLLTYFAEDAWRMYLEFFHHLAQARNDGALTVRPWKRRQWLAVELQQFKHCGVKNRARYHLGRLWKKIKRA